MNGVYVRRGDIERGTDTDHVSIETPLAYEQAPLPSFFHQPAGLAGRWLLRVAITDEFQRLHQPDSAHISDQGELSLKRR